MINPSIKNNIISVFIFNFLGNSLTFMVRINASGLVSLPRYLGFPPLRLAENPASWCLHRWDGGCRKELIMMYVEEFASFSTSADYRSTSSEHRLGIDP
jgi:hypothetical protein